MRIEFPSKNNGFSLIELLVVIAVIAILASIAVPSYQSYSTKAKVAKAYQVAYGLAQSAANTYTRKGSWPTSITWGGYTFPSGTSVATPTLNSSAVYALRIDIGGSNAFRVLISVTGLSGIPGYVDPNPGGANLNSSFVNLTIKETNGAIVTQCGTGVVGDSTYVPIAYHPEVCKCEYLNNYYNGSGSPTCTP